MHYLDVVCACMLHVWWESDITSILLVLTTGPYQYFSLELKSTVDSDLNPLFVRITHTKQRRRGTCKSTNSCSWLVQRHNLLEARGVDQLHVLIDLKERPTTSLTIKVRNTMNQYMLKDNRTVERGRERGRERKERERGGGESVPKCLTHIILYYYKILRSLEVNLSSEKVSEVVHVLPLRRLSHSA